MIANLILFVPGSGGNFLARALTLDTATVALGGIDDNTEQRHNRYHYSNINNVLHRQYNTMSKNGLSSWVSIELEQMYFPLTQGIKTLIGLNKIVVEPMHPEHYETKLGYFGQDDTVNLFYIDPTDCAEWIAAQRIHKGARRQIESLSQTISRVNEEIVQLQRMCEHATAISLSAILKSQDDFLLEYQKTSLAMNLTTHNQYASSIYASWRETWA